MTPPFVLLESHDPGRAGRSFLFEEPADILAARTPEEVGRVLNQVEEETARGRHCAGFLSYEGATGLDTALKTRAPEQGLPVAWFGVFTRRREAIAGDWGVDAPFSLSLWDSSISRLEYTDAIHRIREFIEAGDTYQVNFTFRKRGRFSGSLEGLYRALCRSQRAAYCAYVDGGAFALLSASPELFFRLDGGILETRPMKGTASRGRWREEDDEAGRLLGACPKNRAENLMILDLMRNDIGRVAEIGSVSAQELFTVERYETVWQMVSSARGRLRPGIGLPALLRALFPCGSVTGAPKVRTMELIRDLETTPRGAYTGAIGFVSPGPEVVFNVAIRTVTIDKESGRAECGVGGGITHDSTADSEFEECEVKTRFLLDGRPEFELLESLLFDSGTGFFLLDRHMARLSGSARYFGFRIDERAIREALTAEARRQPLGRSKVRLLVSRDGAFRIERAQIDGPPIDERVFSPPVGAPAAAGSPLRVGFAAEPVDSRDPFLFHKTTHRRVYERRFAAHPEFEDVVLVNERGEATESTRANVVANISGKWHTPPLESGLLAGVLRAELLERGAIRERTLRPEDLRGAKALFLINSVRGWIPAQAT